MGVVGRCGCECGCDCYLHSFIVKKITRTGCLDV